MGFVFYQTIKRSKLQLKNKESEKSNATISAKVSKSYVKSNLNFNPFGTIYVPFGKKRGFRVTPILDLCQLFSGEPPVIMVYEPVQQPSFRTASQRRENFGFFRPDIGTLITFPQEVPFLHATVFDGLTVDHGFQFSGQSVEFIIT